MSHLYSTVQNLAAEEKNSTGAGPALSYKPPSGLSLNLLKWFVGSLKWIIDYGGAVLCYPLLLARKKPFFPFLFLEVFFCLFVPLQAHSVVPSPAIPAGDPPGIVRVCRGLSRSWI
jgi:hypothetical protein